MLASPCLILLPSMVSSTLLMNRLHHPVSTSIYQSVQDFVGRISSGCSILLFYPIDSKALKNKFRRLIVFFVLGMNCHWQKESKESDISFYKRFRRL
jgi:hypothetical protein